MRLHKKDSMHTFTENLAVWWRANHQISCLYQTSTRWRVKDADNVLGAFITELKLRSTSSAKNNFADEITWITWKQSKISGYGRHWTHFLIFELGKVVEKLILLPASLGSISSALALPVSRGRHGKSVDNFSHESDVTSLQDPFTSRPYKTPSRHVPTRPLGILRGTQ